MSKLFIRLFTIADYEEEEIWLREQQKKGLRLVKMVPPCFYTFEEVTPEDVVYRLDYQNKEADEDCKKLYADFGWEYAGRCAGWNYFRKPSAEIESEEESEIFSDNDSKLDMLQKIITTRMLPLMIIFLCCIIPNLMRTRGGSTGDYIITGVFMVLALIYIYLFVHCGTKLRRLKEKYR